MNKMMLMIMLLIAGLVLAGNLSGASKLPHQAEPYENLTVAGQPSLEQLEALSKEGFSTVINLRREGEFDDFDEAEEVERLGMQYVHIPLRNIEAISASDAASLHQAITTASGPVLLHCTIGWRAAGLLAIERYLIHDVSREDALEIAAEAHMSHASHDVEEWIDDNE